eukprot:scaffold95955_cov58-Attheya_sp.AAC.2
MSLLRIGTLSFLIYALARIQLFGKCALLYHHAPDMITILLWCSFQIRAPRKYIARVGEDKSYVLVDGQVSFPADDVDDVDDVTYIHAKSRSMGIGWFKKSNNYMHRWLKIWNEAELVTYGKLVGIVDAEAIFKQNMKHLGGICR